MLYLSLGSEPWLQPSEIPVFAGSCLLVLHIYIHLYTFIYIYGFPYSCMVINIILIYFKIQLCSHDLSSYARRSFWCATWIQMAPKMGCIQWVSPNMTGDTLKKSYSKPSIYYWLVVWTPLKNISQLGLLFLIYGKIKNVPNHQPDYHWHMFTTDQIRPPTVGDHLLEGTNPTPSGNQISEQNM